MFSLALSSIHQFPFEVVKELLHIYPVNQAASHSQNGSKPKETEKSTTITCKCCHWQGKDTEAKTEVIFLEHTTELELYCPKCNSYIGFHK